MLKAIHSYAQASWRELKTVTWPTRKQVISDTILVLAVSILAAIVLGALDLGLQFLLRSALSFTL